MLVHLAMMLSEVSGWVLPSDEKAHDSPLSSHESAITGEVESARDRRRLASSCVGWSVSLPRLLSPLLNRAALSSCSQRPFFLCCLWGKL